MNSKNALSFLVLGLMMHTTPLLALSLAGNPGALADASVRTIWMEFMSWVIGGIGFSYLTRDVAVRMPALLTAMVPERLLHPVEDKSESLQMPDGVRVGISN